MSNLTLVYKHTNREAFRELLHFVCGKNTKNLHLYSVFTGKLQKEDLDAIVQIQKEFSKEHKTVYKNHVVLLESTTIKPAVRKALANHNISVDLPLGSDFEEKLSSAHKELRKLLSVGISAKIWVDVKEDQYQVYRTCAAKGISVNFYDPCYREDTIAWFDSWLRDKTAVPVNTFTDLIHMCTLQVRSPNCRYGSCLANTVYADAEQVLYLCPIHPGESTKLGKMSGDGLQKMFQAEGVYNLICKTVEKREQCVGGCKDFAYCQGGCALKAGTSEDCGSYIKLLHHIEKRLHEVYAGGDLETVNSFVKNAILNVIAFGTAFFDEGRKENV